MKFRMIVCTVLLATAGCDRLPFSFGSAPGKDVDPAQEAAQKNGKQQAEAVVREARVDALEARVSTLENQIDQGEDEKQDTRLDMIDQQINMLTNMASASAVTAPADNATTPSKRIRAISPLP